MMHLFHKWKKWENSTSYYVDTGPSARFMVQFRDCWTCGKRQVRKL